MSEVQVFNLNGDLVCHSEEAEDCICEDNILAVHILTDGVHHWSYFPVSTLSEWRVIEWE